MLELGRTVIYVHHWVHRLCPPNSQILSAPLHRYGSRNHKSVGTKSICVISKTLYQQVRHDSIRSTVFIGRPHTAWKISSDTSETYRFESEGFLVVNFESGHVRTQQMEEGSLWVHIEVVAWNYDASMDSFVHCKSYLGSLIKRLPWIQVRLEQRPGKNNITVE